MAKQKRRLPPKEKRLTPKEFENALVRLEKSAPDIVDEKEFRKRLRQTTVHRYEVALDLIKDVENALLSAGKNSSTKKDLDFALVELDQAIVQMTHASLRFNKAGRAGGVRSILVTARENDTRTPAQRMAEILGAKPK